MPGLLRFACFILLCGLSACTTTYGSLYVGHPQVHTRERLVSERFGEVEWLRGELKNTENITVTIQGYRDYAEISAFTNELRAGFNPAQAPLARADEEIEKTKRDIEQVRRQTELEIARQELEKARNGNGTAPAASTPGATPNPVLPSSPTPLTKDGLLAVPSNKEPIETKAKADVRTLRRIKQAERNDINSDIRATMLDDAHDTQGLTLYQLSLHASLVPGNRSEAFAQIFLSINPISEGAERELQLVGLYYNWVIDLRERILREITRLQTEFDNSQEQVQTGTSAFTDADYAHLREYSQNSYPGLRLSMDGKAKAYEELEKAVIKVDELLKSEKPNDPKGETDQLVRMFLDYISRYRMYVIHTRPGIEAIKTYHGEMSIANAKKVVDTIKQTVGANRPTKPDEIKKMPDPALVTTASVKAQDKNQKLGEEEKSHLREVIGWAAWSRYRGEFAKIVHVARPEFALNGRIKTETGLSIQPVLPIVLDTDELKVRFPKDVHVPFELEIESQGLPVFIYRLERIEERVHALTVDPKEYAQNVSEATARESALNLMLALSAVIPTAGVTAENKTQFVRHTQEVLHALTRKPLLVGFGQGRREFGWVLGPKFMIDGSDSVYRHTPVRHDCAASIVVPAWWTLAKLKGRYAWIGEDGTQFKKEVRQPGRQGEFPRDEPLSYGTLWEKEGTDNSITIELPMATDAHDKITQALTAHSISGDAYWSSSRPKPRIIVPGKGDWKKNMLRAGAPATLLVLGKELWRNPEVYVGSQRADRVSITSDMNGLLAQFDKLQYLDIPTGDGKEPLVQTLHVITSFGPAEQVDSVAVLPEDAVNKTPPPATLLTSGVTYRPNKTTAKGIDLTLKKENKKLSFYGADELDGALARKEFFLRLTDARGVTIELPLERNINSDQEMDFGVPAALLNDTAAYQKLFDPVKGLIKGVASTVELTYKLSNSKSVTIRTVDLKDPSKAGSLAFVQLPSPGLVALKETIVLKKAPDDMKFTVSNETTDDLFKLNEGLEDSVKNQLVTVSCIDGAGKGKKVTFDPVKFEKLEAQLRLTIPGAELATKAPILLGLEAPIFFKVEYSKDKFIKGVLRDDPAKDGTLTFKEEK